MRISFSISVMVELTNHPHPHFLCTWLTITVNVIPTSQLPVLRGFARFCSQAIESALRENTHHALSEPIGISRSVSVIAPGTFLFSLCSTITAWRNTYVWTCAANAKQRMKNKNMFPCWSMRLNMPPQAFETHFHEGQRLNPSEYHDPARSLKESHCQWSSLAEKLSHPMSHLSISPRNWISTLIHLHLGIFQTLGIASGGSEMPIGRQCAPPLPDNAKSSRNHCRQDSPTFLSKRLPVQAGRSAMFDLQTFRLIDGSQWTPNWLHV